MLFVSIFNPNPTFTSVTISTLTPAGFVKNSVTGLLSTEAPGTATYIPYSSGTGFSYSANLTFDGTRLTCLGIGAFDNIACLGGIGGDGQDVAGIAAYDVSVPFVHLDGANPRFVLDSTGTGSAVWANRSAAANSKLFLEIQNTTAFLWLILNDNLTTKATAMSCTMANGYIKFPLRIRVGSSTDPTVPLDVTGAALISTTLGVTGLSTLTGGISLPAAANIALATTTGTMLGTATNQLLGFWNKTPVVQPAAALQAALTNSTGGSQDGTLVDVTTLTVADPIKCNDNFTDIYALLTEIRTALVNCGIIKGAA